MKTKIKICCPCCIWEEHVTDDLSERVNKALVPLDGDVIIDLMPQGDVVIRAAFTCKTCGCGFDISIEKGQWGIEDHEPQCPKGRRMHEDCLEHEDKSAQ